MRKSVRSRAERIAMGVPLRRSTAYAYVPPATYGTPVGFLHGSPWRAGVRGAERPAPRAPARDQPKHPGHGAVRRRDEPGDGLVEFAHPPGQAIECAVRVHPGRPRPRVSDGLAIEEGEDLVDAYCAADVAAVEVHLVHRGILAWRACAGSVARARRQRTGVT